MTIDTQYRTLQEIVYETIKERILNGEYSQGQRLITSDLANEFGVSRMPVREALSRLEAATGLVSMIPHKGAVVNKTSEEDLLEVFHIRAVLEGLAARWACPNITEEDIAELVKINQEIKALSMVESEDSFQKLNLEFHAIIWEKAKASRLREMLETLYDNSRSYRYISVKMPGRLPEIVQEHEEIIDALRRKDDSCVEIIVNSHYRHTLEWLMKQKENKAAEVDKKS